MGDRHAWHSLGGAFRRQGASKWPRGGTGRLSSHKPDEARELRPVDDRRRSAELLQFKAARCQRFRRVATGGKVGTRGQLGLVLDLRFSPMVTNDPQRLHDLNPTPGNGVAMMLHRASREVSRERRPGHVVFCVPPSAARRDGFLDSYEAAAENENSIRVRWSKYLSTERKRVFYSQHTVPPRGRPQ